MQFQINPFFLFFVLLSLIACSGGKSVPKEAAANSIVPVSSFGNEIVQKIAEYNDYTVASIINCGQNITPEVKTFSLFGCYDGELHNKSLSSLNFSGWNHTTNGSETEWTNLKLESSKYNFDNTTKVNNSCNNVQTLDIILVKKTADWNHQHSNGFEYNVLAQGYKFGDIKNLVFDLKINSAKTRIPSVEILKKTYANYVDESVVDAMEDGKVNIGITLNGSTNLNGSVIFQLDQTILSDKWVRVTIPISKLSFYQEINYNQTSKTLEDLKNVVINRMLIVGETKSGAVLRRNINPWNTNIPETFKEMDLSFKKIEIQLKSEYLKKNER
jgi:signal peptidase I